MFKVKLKGLLFVRSPPWDKQEYQPETELKKNRKNYVEA